MDKDMLDRALELCPASLFNEFVHRHDFLRIFYHSRRQLMDEFGYEKAMFWAIDADKLLQPYTKGLDEAKALLPRMNLLHNCVSSPANRRAYDPSGERLQEYNKLVREYNQLTKGARKLSARMRKIKRA